MKKHFTAQTYLSCQSLGEFLDLHLRLNRLRQKDLAETISTSTSFVNFLLFGHKNVSKKIKKALNQYLQPHLTQQEFFHLQCLIEVANGKISLKGLKPEKCDLLLKLSSTPLTDEQILKLQQYIDELNQANDFRLENGD